MAVRGISLMLLAQSLWRFTLSPEWLFALGAGLACTGLALVVGRAVLARRSSAPVADNHEANPADNHDPFEQGSLKEQRKAYRRSQGGAIEVLLSDAASRAQPRHGWVVDRSVGGLRLAVLSPLAEGAVVTVRPATAPPSVPWVEVEIKSCQVTKNGWEVGCQFVKTPPWAVLLLFG
jgi:hypothetical protein